MLLGEYRGLGAPVPIVDAEERVLQILFVVGLLIGDREIVLHVFAAALPAVAGHT